MFIHKKILPKPTSREMAEAIRPVIVRVLRGRGEQVDLIVRSLKSSGEIIPWIKSNDQKKIFV